MNFPEQIKAAYARHAESAAQAFALFKSFAPLSTRVPGCDTVIRLAWRIENGRTIEESAAREYLYRWNLALDGMLNHLDGTPSAMAAEYAPHALGQ